MTLNGLFNTEITTVTITDSTGIAGHAPTIKLQANDSVLQN